MSERRRIVRQPLSRPVFINALMLREGKESLPCTLLDVSDLGARLRTEHARELPEHFTIALTERGVPRRQCRVVWRGDHEVGVSFEADKTDGESRSRELAPGSTLDDALDVFGSRG